MLISLAGIELKPPVLWKEHISPKTLGTATSRPNYNSSYTSWAKQGMFVSHKKRNIFGHERLFFKEK